MDSPHPTSPVQFVQILHQLDSPESAQGEAMASQRLARLAARLLLGFPQAPFAMRPDLQQVEPPARLLLVLHPHPVVGHLVVVLRELPLVVEVVTFHPLVAELPVQQGALCLADCWHGVLLLVSVFLLLALPFELEATGFQRLPTLWARAPCIPGAL